MPIYEYFCKECKKTFTVAMRLEEYSHAHVFCPKCKSRKIEQKPAAFFAVSAKKS